MSSIRITRLTTLVVACLLVSTLRAAADPTVISLPGRATRGLAADSGYLWVTHSVPGNPDSSMISKVDRATGSPVLQSNPLNWNSRGICLAEGSLWVTDALHDVVHQVSPSNFQELSSFPTPGTEPCGITFDGTHLWVSDPWARCIFEMSTSGAVLSSFDIPNEYRTGLEWECNGVFAVTGDVTVGHYSAAGTLDWSCNAAGLPAGSQVFDVAFVDGYTYASTHGEEVYRIEMACPTPITSTTWGALKALRY